MLRFDIITLFPKMFESPFAESIIARACKNGLIEINTHQLRDYALDKHKTTDDTPCGGGPGMVIKVDVVDEALRHVILPASRIDNGRSDPKCNEDKSKDLHLTGAKFYGADSKKTRIVMLSASGQKFTQQKAIELAKFDNIVLLCGHYEGFDYRIHQHLVDEEISIGDYVLTGGEIPAMVVIDAVTRMVPGAIKEESVLSESFMPRENQKSKIIGQNCNSKVKNLDANKLTPDAYNLNYDYPVYTRPVDYKGWLVPEVLLTGNHVEIEKWRDNRSKMSQ